MKSVTGRSLIAVYFLKLFKSSCKPDMASRDWTAWLLDWAEPPHGAATAVSQSGFSEWPEARASARSARTS